MPHVLVDVYAVQHETFNPLSYNGYAHWIAEVSAKGLDKGDKEDPFGITAQGADEKETKNLVRDQLKELGFSKKQVEYRRV